jgi:hypothetical protein
MVVIARPLKRMHRLSTSGGKALTALCWCSMFQLNPRHSACWTKSMRHDDNTERFCSL